LTNEPRSKDKRRVPEGYILKYLYIGTINFMIVVVIECRVW